MPQALKRVCSGCGAAVLGRCARCQRKQDQQRGTATSRGYDGDHRRLRIECFRRDSWRCVDCGWQPDIVRATAGYGVPAPEAAILEELRGRKLRHERHLHADHQIPIEQAPELRLVLSNYRTRCNACHSSKTIGESVNALRGRGGSNL